MSSFFTVAQALARLVMLTRNIPTSTVSPEGIGGMVIQDRKRYFWTIIMGICLTASCFAFSIDILIRCLSKEDLFKPNGTQW